MGGRNFPGRPFHFEYRLDDVLVYKSEFGNFISDCDISCGKSYFFMGIGSIIKFVALMSVPISAIWALIVYKKQQKIARIQNLVSVFRRFAENSQFVELFALCDALYSCGDSGARAADIEKLKTFDSGGKYRYLALLEEVAVYAKNDAVLQSDALHLFQYHFHYIYNCPDIVAAFWWNIGGEASGREHTKKGWRYQSDFALQCRASIGR